MEAATSITSTGPFTIVVNAEGAVVTSGWTATAAPLLDRAGIRGEVTDRRDVGAASTAAAAYFAGQLDAIDDVAVAQTSTPFTETCWELLRDVPPGDAWTYSDLARAAAHPAAARAAAGSCARNNCGLFVPCHRISRKDGGLGGFAWGVDVKQFLLAHESRP